MTLSEFLQLKGLTHAEFATLADIPRPTITRLVKPGARPDWANIEKIRRATDGKVSPNDWVSSMQGAA